MATRSYKATINADKTHKTVAATDLVAAISYTAVASAIATLVADGASPTQAHVTTLNTAWTTLKAAIDAAQAHVSSSTQVYFDDTTYTKAEQIIALGYELARSAVGNGHVTK